MKPKKSFSMSLHKSILLAMAIAGVTLSACKKDEPEEPTPDTDNETVSPSAQDLGNYFNDNRENQVETFTADASNAISITTSGGTTFEFPPNSFKTSNGNTVSGNINLDVVELLDKREMVLTYTPTMGALSSGGTAPLISGGEFRVTASQNGNDLELRDGYSYNAQVPAPNGVDSNMDIFYGNMNGDTLIWSEADSGAIWGQNGMYQTYFDSLSWINCDYFMDSTGNNTNVQVELPNGFNSNNCVLMASLDGMNSLVNIYNFQNGVFSTAPNYTLPIGTDLHFIAVAFINGNPHTAIVPATIQNNHYETIPALTQTTPSQFQSDINALP